MLKKLVMLTFAGMSLLAFGEPALAQNACYVKGTPPGTYPMCGKGMGQYRPQPYTLRGFRKVPAPNMWYAPSGPGGKYWNQYNARDKTYGPREPNPFRMDGRLSPRVFKHVYETRVRPRLHRRD